MKPLKKFIIYFWICWLSTILWQNFALAGKIGEATESNELEFLTEAFKIIMPTYVKNGYDQSDPSLLQLLKSGYIACETPPQEIQDAIDSLTDEEKRTVAITVNEMAAKYLCP